MTSVGTMVQDALNCWAHNTVFSPNLSPDQRGLIPDDQVQLMADLGAALADRGLAANYPSEPGRSR